MRVLVMRIQTIAALFDHLFQRAFPRLATGYLLVSRGGARAGLRIPLIGVGLGFRVYGLGLRIPLIGVGLGFRV